MTLCKFLLGSSRDSSQKNAPNDRFVPGARSGQARPVQEEPETPRTTNLLEGTLKVFFCSTMHTDIKLKLRLTELGG